MSKVTTKEQLYKDINKYMEYQGEMYYIYSDIVDNRNLNPVAFFKYIYDNYESIDYIKRMIQKMEKSGLVLCSNNIKIIMDYKEAILMHNKELKDKLEPKFKEIKDVRKALNKNSLGEICSKTRKEKIESTYMDINLEIDEYLSCNKEYDETEYRRLKRKISRKIDEVDSEKYIMFIGKKYNIKDIDIKEIDELIETLKYFIINLTENLSYFKAYSYMIKTKKKEYKKLISSKNHLDSKEKIEKIESIIDLYSNKVLTELTDIEVNYNIPILSICNSKISAMENMMNNYLILLNKLIIFKNKLDNNNIEEIKLSNLGIKDDFILSIVDEIKTLLNGYNAISKVTSKSKEKIKEEFLKKYVYDSRD